MSEYVEASGGTKAGKDFVSGEFRPVDSGGWSLKLEFSGRKPKVKYFEDGEAEDFLRAIADACGVGVEDESKEGDGETLTVSEG